MSSFFFNDTATTEIYTLSLHDALPIFSPIMKSVIAFAKKGGKVLGICNGFQILCEAHLLPGALLRNEEQKFRSEEHTSEFQSRQYLVCRLLLEKKKHARRAIIPAAVEK